MTPATATVRPFTPADYEGYVAGSNACYPDYPLSVAEMRHGDASFDTTRYFTARFVVEDGGRVVGGVHVHHRPSRFHPDRYAFDLWVVPDARRRGHGSRLYDAAIGQLVARNALAVTTGVKESMTDGVQFLEKRGWVEVKRDWESRLRVSGFDFAKFASANERVARDGIRITTFAEEARRDPKAERKAYELIAEVRRDVPATDAATDESFEDWQKHWTGSPSFMPDAFFAAIDRDGRWLGLSNLECPPDDRTFFWQGLTGMRREARGRGVAMALKLRTVEYARRMGVDHVKTWNDQKNRPMLAINEALGFEKQPAWIAFEKRFRA